ncbi:MAG: elongation factor P hydroxylase [Cellvibrionaceae bacterium]
MISRDKASQIVELFNREFEGDCQTRLVGGGQEPLYEPANEERSPSSDKRSCHQIIFTQDYPSSALHEVAHWCIAGPERRKQVDYGYWYAPDGRDDEQQRLFESVEIKPQALEWVFSIAARVSFKVSADNLEGDSSISASFKEHIYQQAITYCEDGLPTRAERFVRVLVELFYPEENASVEDVLNAQCYHYQSL